MPEVFINTSAGGYAPPLYLPAALTIALGKSFKLSPLWLMYLGRLANLMVFLGLIYWTLKITPTGKSVIFLLSLMPMTIFLAPSLSIDGLTIASSFLLAATLLELNYYTKQPVKRYTWLIVPTTLIILALGKIVYCPLILLFFLSPKALFGKDRSRLYLLAVSLVLAAASYFLWRWFTNNAGTAAMTNIPFDYTSFQTTDQLTPLIDSQKQLHFLKQYPGAIFSILKRTLQTQSIYYMESFIGFLGWLDTRIPIWICISYPIALLAATTDSRPVGNQLLIEKTVLILIWGIASGAIMVGFYILATPIGNAIISGIQGRYFIPIALPFLLLFSFDSPHFVKSKNRATVFFVNNWTSLYTTIVLLTITLTLWSRYYNTP